MRRFVLSAAIALTGCTTTGTDFESPFTAALFGASWRAAAMATTLAAETAWAVDANPGAGACPSGAWDGDDLTLSWGNGCQPESGFGTATIAGAVALTIPAAGGIYVGDAAQLGFGERRATGAISGDVVRSGGALSTDFEWAGLAWTQDGAPQTLDALVRLDTDDTGTWVEIEGAVLRRGDAPSFTLELSAHIAPGLLNDCFVPDEGSYEVVYDNVRGTMSFDGGAASQPAAFSDRTESDSIPLCPE